MTSRNPDAEDQPTDKAAGNEEEPSSIWPADRENGGGAAKAAGPQTGGSEEEEEES